MASFTSSVPVPTIDATGLHIPDFASILAALQSDYRGIYGADVVLDNSTQDGQWVGIQASAYNDFCAAMAAVYNAFSPSTAQGTGLSSVVKINGIAREVPSNSTADLLVIGQAGTILTGAIASDDTYKWLLPTLTIPVSGEITVTAICATVGAVTAAPGTITTLSTPTRGWQSVSNPAPATPGSPVETDPQLRVRQAISTALPSVGLLDGILGGIAQVSGVVRFRGYENDTNLADANGIPGHALAVVVDGGDAQAIANAIGVKKLGGGTYGTTIETYTDSYGISHRIAFFRPTEPPVTWAITVKVLAGFTVDVQAAVQQALSDWTNALGIGNNLLLTRAYVPANLGGSAASATYEVMALAVGRDGASPTQADITFAFNEAPSCAPGSVVVTVTT